MATIGLVVAGNRYEVAHHPLPEGLERVWQNSEIWSIPAAVVLLASAPLAIGYLNRLLHAEVKNAIIYAFSAWIFTRVSWLQSFSWLRSSQLGDEWRKVFVTGPYTVEASVAVAVTALIVAIIVARSNSSIWAPALIASFALPAVVQYWMAGERIALLDGIFSLALFGYTASRMMQHSVIIQIDMEIDQLNVQSTSPSRQKQKAVKIVLASVLCTIAIALIAVSIGVKPMSIASSVVILAMAIGTFIVVRLTRQVMQKRFNETAVATTATISSLVIASLIVNGSWIPSNITHPDFDGWLLYGLQVVSMALIGCVGLIVILDRMNLHDFRPFFACLTIPLLAYLVLWDFPLPNVSSWETGNVFPLPAHKWVEMSVVLTFILSAIWFVFGPAYRNTNRRSDQPVSIHTYGYGS